MLFLYTYIGYKNRKKTASISQKTQSQ